MDEDTNETKIFKTNDKLFGSNLIPNQHTCFYVEFDRDIPCCFEYLRLNGGNRYGKFKVLRLSPKKGCDRRIQHVRNSECQVCFWPLVDPRPSMEPVGPMGPMGPWGPGVPGKRAADVSKLPHLKPFRV